MVRSIAVSVAVAAVAVVVAAAQHNSEGLQGCRLQHCAVTGSSKLIVAVRELHCDSHHSCSIELSPTQTQLIYRNTQRGALHIHVHTAVGC
jgi:hypothetical protein